MADDARERACDPPALPPALGAVLDGYAWVRDTVGESGGAVYRLHGRSDAPDLYLKTGAGSVARDVTDEMARLLWLADHLPVPRVVHFTATGDAAWLLTTALPGRTAWQVLADEPERRGAIVDALADFLRRVHAIPVADCPFNADQLLRLAHARRRIDAGLVEEDEFDDARDGWSAERVWSAIQALMPIGAERVVTHGDFSLDNLLIEDGVVTGCIDVGRVGVADPYQDLAILWNCLGAFDPALQDRLFRRYGIDAPDRRRLDFHLMLDELF